MNIRLRKFISIFSAEQDAYPIRNNQVTASAEVKFGNEMNVRMGVQQLSGYVYATEDGSKKFQPTLTGFTFNRLAPYDSWEQFSAEALRWVLPRFSGQYV